MLEATSELMITLSSSTLGLSTSLEQALSHIMNTIAIMPPPANKNDLIAVDSWFPMIPTIKMVIKSPVHAKTFNQYWTECWKNPAECEIYLLAEKRKGDKPSVDARCQIAWTTNFIETGPMNKKIPTHWHWILLPLLLVLHTEVPAKELIFVFPFHSGKLRWRIPYDPSYSQCWNLRMC